MTAKTGKEGKNVLENIYKISTLDFNSPQNVADIQLVFPFWKWVVEYWK